MSSLRKTESNRNNARLSTGPRTPEGKSRSSQNAQRHGLTARHLVLSIEDRSDYEELRAGLIQEYAPDGTQELLLVTQIADSFWRLQRAKSIETALFERDLDLESATPEMTLAGIWERRARDFDLLRRYTKGFESAYFRAISTLRQIQKDRRRDPSRPPARIPRRDPAPELGFVSNPNKSQEISSAQGSDRRPAAPLRDTLHPKQEGF